MKRYSAILFVLLIVLMLALVGCGESGGDGSSPWERAATQAGDKYSGDYSDEGDLYEDIYSDLCGAYANPGGSYELLLLYEDGTYVLDAERDLAYGDYTADAAAMTVDLKGQGTWFIGSGFAYMVDRKGDPWAKVIEDILKDADNEGTMTEGTAEDEVKKSRSRIDDIFTEEELEELDREAMEQLGDDSNVSRGASNYTYEDVTATYGHPSAGDRQLTLYIDARYEEGYGLHYCCGLYTISGDTIYFWEDPEEMLTALPWIGDSVTIGDNGRTLIDSQGNVWRREIKVEPDPYEAF